MEAIGIQAVLIDEYLAPDNEGGRLYPGYDLPGGGFRPIGPNAEAAALVITTASAPDAGRPVRSGLEGWIETLAASPNMRALRTVAFAPKRSPPSPTAASTAVRRRQNE